jgi:transposase
MDKRTKTVVGIDVSKLTLDICVKSVNGVEMMNIPNNVRSIKGFLRKLVARECDGRILVGMENTGMYNWSFYEAVQDVGVSVFVINALHLKKCMGLVRGKNDRVDAQRIADHIDLHERNMTPSVLPERSLRKLRVLVTCRKRLVRMRTSMSVPARELASLKDKDLAKGIGASAQRLSAQIDKEIAAIEERIRVVIEGSAEMTEKFKLITSVPGVGKVLAWELLIKTDMFRSISDPRKLACFAGVVPFEHSSGTSVNRRPRVSMNADRALKKLLHLAALRVTQLNGELQDYYFRKVAEGKNKMAVINALRNKIVARVCSAVNNNRPYEKKLVLS